MSCLSSQRYNFLKANHNDGPKPGAEAKVEAVRGFIREIEGFKSVTIHASPENRGLARSIIAGVTKILESHSSVIVMEDDLLTSPNFLDFMNQGLSFYRDIPKVLSISGYSFPIDYPADFPYDATFGICASSWGWATWKTRWESVDWECREWKRMRFNPLARWRFNRGGSDISLMLSCHARQNQLLGDPILLPSIQPWPIRCIPCHIEGRQHWS